MSGRAIALDKCIFGELELVLAKRCRRELPGGLSKHVQCCFAFELGPFASECLDLFIRCIEIEDRRIGIGWVRRLPELGATEPGFGAFFETNAHPTAAHLEHWAFIIRLGAE